MLAALRTFRPPLWAILVYLLVLAGMLALGRWQLVRADEKIDLIERAATARAADPVPVNSLLDEPAVAVAAADYRRVTATGRWLPERQFLWDNRAHGGRAGVEVIAALELEDGRTVLVNRGWQPLGTRREQLPDTALEAAPVALAGLFSRPSRGFAKGDAFDKAAPWPRYLQYFDYAAIAGALDAPLIDGVLQPGAAYDEASWRFVPNWQPAASGPEKHYSYAVQWFAMALALTMIFVVVNRPGRAKDGPHPAGPHPAGPHPAGAPPTPAHTDVRTDP